MVSILQVANYGDVFEKICRSWFVKLRFGSVGTLKVREFSTSVYFQFCLDSSKSLFLIIHSRFLNFTLRSCSLVEISTPQIFKSPTLREA